MAMCSWPIRTGRAAGGRLSRVRWSRALWPPIRSWKRWVSGVHTLLEPERNLDGDEHCNNVSQGMHENTASGSQLDLPMLCCHRVAVGFRPDLTRSGDTLCPVSAMLGCSRGSSSSIDRPLQICDSQVCMPICPHCNLLLLILGFLLGWRGRRNLELLRWSANFTRHGKTLTSGRTLGSPEPTCSQGEAASAKFLFVSSRSFYQRLMSSPECLGELQRLVHHPLLLLVVADFRVALGSVDAQRGESGRTVRGKSFLNGCPSKP